MNDKLIKGVVKKMTGTPNTNNKIARYYFDEKFKYKMKSRGIKNPDIIESENETQISGYWKDDTHGDLCLSKDVDELEKEIEFCKENLKYKHKYNQDLQLELAELKNDPPLLPMMDRQGTKRLLEQEKEIAELKEGIEKIITNLYKKTMDDTEHELKELLSPKQKETDPKTKDPEWSQWYEYKGEVDFKDIIEIEPSTYSRRYDRYKIKLDGVRVIEYETIEDDYFICVTGEHINDVLGVDPHNKIIILEDK